MNLRGSNEEWAEHLRAAGIQPPTRWHLTPEDMAPAVRQRGWLAAFFVRVWRRMLNRGRGA